MKLIFPVAVFSCACAVFGAREDLVYRNPKNPGMIASNRDTKESEASNSIESKASLIQKKDSSDSENLDKSEIMVKDGASYDPKNMIAKKYSPGGSASYESGGGPKGYDESYYDLPRNVKKNKNRRPSKKRQQHRPRDSVSEEQGAPIIDLENDYNDVRRDILSTGIPPYDEALENFDAALDIIQMNFKREAFTYEENKDLRFVIIAVVVDGLSKIVAEKGWGDYDGNYRNLVKALAEKAAVKPMESVDMIRCVFKKAHDRVQKIRSIMNNEWTRAICNAQPQSCNAVIYVQIKSSQNYSKKLDNQANILIKLGESAATYLNNYANVFEAVSNLNAYQYLATGKEGLRHLVRKNAEVRNLLFPNGGPTAEECGVNSY